MFALTKKKIDFRFHSDLDREFILTIIIFTAKLLCLLAFGKQQKLFQLFKVGYRCYVQYSFPS